MQNLQIKYGEFSAQLEYLDLHNLVEEEEIHRHSLSDFDQLSEEKFEFNQRLEEANDSIEAITYEQFVGDVIKIHAIRALKQYERQVKVFAIIIMGDLFEYAYHSHQNQIKAFQFFAEFKWAVILHALLLFLCLSCFPLECIFISLLITAYFTKEEEECESQVVRAASFKATFSNLINRLKCIYLDQEIVSQSALKNLNNNLNLLVNNLQRRYQFALSSSHFPIDKLNESIYLLHEQLKKNNYSALFIQNRSFLKRKFYYWKLKLENQELTRFASLLSQIHAQFMMETLQKEVKYVKPHSDQAIYFRILFSRLQHEYNQVKNGKNQQQELEKLQGILSKEVEFKRILKMRQQGDISGKELASQEGKESIPLFQEARRQAQSYYYEADDTLTPYKPDPTEAIKSKLDELFKQKQEKQANSAPSDFKPLQPIQPERPERLIFCFGIPLAPPPRDMSAYYIE